MLTTLGARAFRGRIDSPSISVSANASSVSVVDTGTVTITYTLTRNGNYTGTVTPAVTGLPTGVAGGWSDSSLTGADTTTILTLTSTAAPEVVLDPFTVTFSGSGVSDYVLSPTVTVTASSGAIRYFRPTQINAELPRGVSSNYNLLFNESTQTLSTVGGGSYPYLWDWEAVRVGAARHAAATRLTVSSTGTAGWAEFVAHVATFVAGSGDYEILMPSSVTIPGSAPADNGWVVPQVTGDRRLFITSAATLPTANTMPTTAAVEACSVILGPSFFIGDSLITINHPNCARITMTGIKVKPQNNIAYQGIIEVFRHSSVTTMSDVPLGLVLDRCWVDGSGTNGTYGYMCRRGLMLNGQQCAVLETWVTDIRHDGSEATGIAGYSGSKYLYFRNVYDEAGSIGMLWGGAQPQNSGTGNCDPSDILCQNVSVAKKAAWVSTPLSEGKNGFEAKNCTRWFIWNCVTHRHIPGAQPAAMLFQNLQENGEVNENYNAVKDVVVHNHDFIDCRLDGISIAARIGYGASVRPVQPTQRLAIDNVRFTQLATNGSARGKVVQLSGDLENILLDRFTLVDCNTKNLVTAIADVVPDGKGVNMIVTNWAGKWTEDATYPTIAGIYGATDLNTFNIWGLAWLAAAYTSSTWDGHAFYSVITSKVTDHQPGLTHYQNAVLATAASNMGFNTSTGAITGAGADDGVGGSTPGCDLTQLNAGIASMAGWAYSR